MVRDKVGALYGLVPGGVCQLVGFGWCWLVGQWIGNRTWVVVRSKVPPARPTPQFPKATLHLPPPHLGWVGPAILSSFPFLT